MIKFENSTFIIQSNLPLSKIIKIFENFKIEILDIEKKEDTLLLKTPNETIHPEIIKIIKDILEDKLPIYCKLYYLANFGLNIREISLVRAIVKYQKQLLYEFEEEKVIKELNKYPKITKLVIEYFLEKFSKQEISREKTIEEELKKLIHPESHKILEYFYIIVKNMVRTNYFLNKDTISFKVYTQNFKNILFGIQPNIEMFVYHHEFNGIHLRMSKISRGGIRHSNRSDFREEIKDLVKTQAIKNAFIIPDGAKGGFITQIEPKIAYQKFIDALLDLIDVGDTELIKYDGEDFYFVVAADKGTAHFSDLANEIAIKRGYFLKDAFASGGSTGYSHKELGITAKGAIKAASRHFLEISKDIYNDEISVVGVGSMRGDVFGNGMLLNKKFKLIGAISHKYIFVDPNPDVEVAFKERLRLFKEEKGWEEYDKNKISKGGGVFRRDERVKLSSELKKLFNTKKHYLSGEEIAKELLKLKVDMLYFGGIGTYIKSSDELNIHISDKENENIRVNANEIKAFSICEGANLALTTKARYEYALNGGKINLDAIDNSGGVNISDMEVNIKIHLNSLVEKGEITEEKKIEILKELTDEVVERVLKNNYDHSLIITLDSKRVYKEKLIKIIELLETTDFFKRHYYALPKNSEIETIYKNGELIRPVTALIMLNVKNFLKKYIASIEDEYFNNYFSEYFPSALNVKDHPLKREIIAANITNKIINSLGIGFVADFNKNFKNKIVSFLIINELIEAEKLYTEIKALDFKMPTQKQYEFYLDIHETIKFAIRWLVKAIENSNINPFVFLVYKNELKEIIPEINIENYKKLKTYFKFLPAILHLRHQNYNLKVVFKLFEIIISKFKINKLLKEIHNFKPQTKLEKDLKEEVEEMVEFFVIKLATEILFSKNFNEKEVKKSFNEFLKSKEEKYKAIIEDINQAKTLNEFTHIANSLILQLLK